VNTPLSFGFLFLGLVAIIAGIIWILRLSSSEEDDNPTTENGDRLISVGFGEYNTEGLVMFRGAVAIILGIIFIVVGILS
jgi:uncharacterized membrane protein HdeD (DUF308 family)